MLIRSDFNAREVVAAPSETDWVASALPGVDRHMLDRIGAEAGYATSIVRYAPGSRFSEHSHPGGEEFLVLEGVFSDEHGDYPPGTYVRNPPGSSHSPYSVDGCTIFVKLWQFNEQDLEPVRCNTNEQSWRAGLVAGLQVLPLHTFDGVNTALVRWAPHTQFQEHTHLGGEEILVLSGVLYDEHGSYPQGTWLRSPPSSTHTPYTKDEGALIYVKTGHLHKQT